MLKPAVIVGDVPPDYSGPLYYRARTIRNPDPRYLQASPIIFDPPPLGQTIATADNMAVAFRVAPQFFDADGRLLPEFSRPLSGRFRSGVPAQLPEICVGLFFYTRVSSRVRDVVERLEPGRNLFLPVDVARKDAPIERLYLFYVQLDHKAFPLAFRANGVEPSFTDAGDPFRNNWHDQLHGPHRFTFLNSAAIGPRHLYVSVHTGILYSAAVVEALGDVLPPNMAFVPMGVVDEPYRSPAFQQAAASSAGSPDT